MHESEKHCHRLLNLIDEGFCIIEVIFDENEKPIDYRFIETNLSFEKQTGLINAQGKRMSELAPKHEEYWFEIYGKIAVTGQPVRFVNRAEQFHRWYEVYAFRYGQPENRQVAILFNDITERKQAEEVFHESAARLAKAEQVAHFGHWDLDIKNQKLVWSKEIYRLFAKDPDTFVPTFETFLATMHPEDRGQFLCIRDEAMAEGRDFTIDYRIILPDGSLRFMQEIVEIIRNGVGNPTKIFGTIQDITERKRAEEALRRSEQKYRLLVSQIPAMVFQGYGDWSIDPLDEKVEVLTGYSKEDFESRRVKWCDLIPAEDLDYATRVFMEALKTDKSYVREHRLRKKDGEIIWVQCRGQIFLNDQGKVDYISGVSFDVTQRKQAEEALIESDKISKVLLDSNPESVLLLDKELTVITANQTAAKRFGKRLNKIIGVSLYDLFPTDVLKTRKPYFDKVFRTGRPVTFEDIREGINFHTYISPILDEAGKVSRIAILGIDITKRKQAEENLRESEEKFRAIFDHANDGILLADEKTLKFGIANKKICEMLGYSIEEIQSLGVNDIHPRGSMPHVMEQIKRNLSGGTPHPPEIPVQRKDGSVFYADINSVPMMLAGKRYLLGIFRDITGRKEAEEEKANLEAQLF
jgi:PAS domain S-box-containing protein